MKRTTRTAMLAAGAVALALSATLVAAQPGGFGPCGGAGDGPGPGWGMGSGMGPGPGWGMGQGMGYGARGMGPYGYGRGPQATSPAGPGFGVEARLAAVKTELKITADQDKAWQAYVDQMKAQVETMKTWRATMHSTAPGTAPERIELHTAMMKQRVAMAEETEKVVKGLYEVLAPEQRALVDQGLLAMGPGMGRGPGWRYR
jgi:Spy/CpxP family protein refolding chaperone